MTDSDRDGLPDAWENLITHASPTNANYNVDADGDGMPDAWEFLNGLNPQSNDANADADGDGISNLQEFVNEQQLLHPREPLGPCSRRTPLVISEIMYNGVGGQSDYVEIYNTHHLPQKMDGYTIFNADNAVAYFTFPAGSTLAAGSFTNIPLPGSLPERRRVQLRNSSGAVLLDIEYSNKPPWPTEADGAGHSLILARPSFSEGSPLAWAASERGGGSPGYAETNPFDPLRYITINEFLANGTNSEPDFIELHNACNQPTDISGCYLSDDASLLTNRFQIPQGTIIPARGFRVFVQNPTNSFDFGLSAGGEQIFLTNPEGTRVIDAVRFEGQPAGVSTGRYPDGAPVFVEVSNRTPGTNNAPPLTRDVVINEIMFNPISGSNADEYIELYNRGPNSQNLLNWSMDGVGFTFTGDHRFSHSALSQGLHRQRQ